MRGSQGALAAVLGLGCAALAVGCELRLAPSCAVQTDGADAPRREDGATAGACPGPGRSGQTQCGARECSAGLHCVESPLPQCEPGCTSDLHCGARDACVRAPGEATGRCEPCAQQQWREAPAGCVVAERSGSSDCFFAPCTAGSYCDPAQHCTPGCASDENCGPTEQCVRAPGAAVGVCRSCYAPR
ncbi:MAG: hypothetical protein K1X88_33205 [Nannocystaceae bacterium]|nr:hypothetical protein [Nannocystaceae bacterium]